MNGNFFRVLKLYQGNLVVLTTSFHCMWGNHLDSNLWSNRRGHFLFGDGEECLNALSDLSQHMVNAKRILLLRVEICILNTQTVIICSEAYVRVLSLIYLSEEFLANNLHTAQKDVAENADGGSCIRHTQGLCSGKGRKLVTMIMPLWKVFWSNQLSMFWM